MSSNLASAGTRLVVALVIALPALVAAPARPAAAATGPCGEIESLPGPGHYSGGLKGTLVRKFPAVGTELTLPLGGTLELDLDDHGHVVGIAAAQYEATPGAPGLPVKASASFDVHLDGQLPDPVAGADVPGRGELHLGAAGPLGQSLGGYDGLGTLHLRGFERNLCAAIQGSWDLDELGSDEAGRWELRDAQWAAKLEGFNEDLEREVRGTVGFLVGLPPDQALGLSPSLSAAEADALIDAMVAGAAALPSGGLFELYQKVLASPAPPAQIRCLTDFVQTAIAGKLQQYLAAGGSPTYEDAARYGYGLKVDQGVGSGPSCPAFAGGLGGLKQIIGASLGAAIADGTDLDRVARLTREAQLFGFNDLAQQGRDWLQQKGRPL